MQEIVIQKPEHEEIQAEYASAVGQANMLEIATVEQHGAGLECLKRLKRAQKMVVERLEPLCKKAFEAHRGLTELRADLLAPIKHAVRILNGKLDAYEKEAKRVAELVSRDLPITVAPDLADTAGVHKRKTWYVEVMDICLLAEYVGRNPDKAHLLLANTAALNKMARAQQGALRIPGVKVVCEEQRIAKSA